MSRKRQRYKPLYYTTKLQRNREVRDCYNKLRKKYRLDVVYEFLRQNYHLQMEGVDYVINLVDREPVDLTVASLQYKTIMREDFNI